MPFWFEDEDFFPFRRFWKQMEKSMRQGIRELPEAAFERTPISDIEEDKNQIIIRLDIPGVDKKDIQLFATEDKIEVKAERKEFSHEEKKNFFRRERSYKAYSRSLSLPAKIDPHSIKADYNNGVLTLTATKKGAKTEKKIRVKI